MNPARQKQSRRDRVVLGALCALPLLFALPTIGDPYGTAEEALNPAIWGLGARNIVEHGFVQARRGAQVAPYPGTRLDGLYAHHPPGPVWVMTIPVLIGGWEGWARLIAVICAALSLRFLARALGRVFDDRTALAATAVAATSGFLLADGHLFNTVTLATPLFCWLLDATLSPDPLPRWTPVIIGALVLSSWDGLLGAAALLAFVGQRAWRSRQRGLLAASIVVALGTIAFVAWHLVEANGGTDGLLWQFKWRSSGDEFTLGEWLIRQGRFLANGLGPLTLGLLLVAPIAWIASRKERSVLVAFALAAVPGVAMVLIFRQGAHRHFFWGYNLVLPAAFAVAMALKSERLRWPLGVALAVQAVWCAGVAGERRTADHQANSVGALVQRQWSVGTDHVAMLTHYNYHPYVAWNVRARPDWALTREELGKRVADGVWTDRERVLVDSDFARKLGCGAMTELDRSEDRRWIVAAAGDVAKACAAGHER